MGTASLANTTADGMSPEIRERRRLALFNLNEGLAAELGREPTPAELASAANEVMARRRVEDPRRS